MRLIGFAFALLTLYYARFFLSVRQEAWTLAQIGVLLVAAAVLILPVRVPLTARGAAWLQGGWQPLVLHGWVIAAIAVALATAVFVLADRDAHSASDTLNRAVPSMCLITAVALRIAHR